MLVPQPLHTQSSQASVPSSSTAVGQGRTAIYLTVQDQQGGFVSSLTREDLRLVVDDKYQDVVSLSFWNSQFANLALLLDWSGSRRIALPYGEIDPAIGFFNSMLSDNRAGLATRFTDFVKPIIDLTRDPAVMERSLKAQRSEPLRGSTPLYDAIRWADQRLSRAPGYRAIIVVSDGEDNSSRVNAKETILETLRANAAVYFINLSDLEPHRPRNLKKAVDQFVQQITEKTGGAAISVRNQQDMARAFSSIEDSLRNLYLLEFDSLPEGPPGMLHTLRIETDRKDLRVRSPQLLAP